MQMETGAVRRTLCILVVACVTRLTVAQLQLPNVIIGEPNDESTDAQASAVNNLQLKWTHGVVPYVISASFSNWEREVIAGAVAELHKRTCVRFIPRASHHHHYIHILSGRGCSSSVGRKGGVQVVSLGVGCGDHNTVLHEFLHALGFWHEHARPDRDLYVDVNWNNILPSEKFNFHKKSSWATSDLDLAYDFSSVMHYHPHAFALNPALPTLIPRVPGVIFSHHQGLSQTDIERVNRLYQCEHVQPLPTTTSTPAPTPAPKPAPTPKPRPQECVDNHKLCWNWAQKGRCTSSAFVSTTCKKSCGTCPRRVVCEDKHKDCGWWAGRGECVKRPDYMSSRCRFSCGFCSA